MSLIPNSNIRVDDFTAPDTGLTDFVFFLTHIHTDHLKGLSNTWNLGRIYTSEVTARLLIDRWPNLKLVVTPLAMLEEHTIFLDPKQEKESMTVTLFDSNHCPGSTMFLFKGEFGSVLHTGDFRYSSTLFKNYPQLYPANKRNEEEANISVPIDHLIVDSTFANLDIEFPSQEEAQ